ncbi:unnamed protein product [Symbiodinium sp. KB8]|nr:unnamed protein product [Symbiodinium sp. KB8]
MAAQAGSKEPTESSDGLRGTRRRLSVVSDNKLIEGLASMGEAGTEEITSKTAKHVVKSYAGLSKKGYAPYNPRKRNQDSIMMVEDPATGSLLFGVLDGHGEAGDLVSHYLTDRIPDRVFAHKKWATDPLAALSEETAKLEAALLSGACACSPPVCAGVANGNTSIDTEFSGTTAVMGVLRGNKLAVANIGDSRVILGEKTTGGTKAIEVSLDHKPDRPDEQKRIESCGGRVFAVEYDDGVDGPPRVWLGHMDIPGLAMSRSLGDSVAHTAGVISEPELTEAEVGPNVKTLIMGSDGLWEFISNQEALDMIEGITDPKKAVDILVSESGERWMKEEQVIDDTTVIVAYF